MTPPLPLATASGAPVTLAAAGELTADVAARTITGLAVPYGPVGQTSAGRLQFSAGSLSWTDPRRVKLLTEHDQNRPVGFALELAERPDGLHATFSVPASPEGDLALAQAADGRRDAFSVGVQLDEASLTSLRRAGSAAVQGRGALREVSLVSVPAFDDARVGAVAAHSPQLVVTSWSTPTPTPHPEGSAAMPPSDQLAPPAVPAPTAAPDQQPAVSAPAPAAPLATAAAAPLAVAGNAVVTSEASTYGFSADGPSLVRDAYAARMDGNGEAGQRLARFNAELTNGNVPSRMALAAVMVTDDAPEFVAPNVRRPDLLLTAVDRGRPLNSRVRTVPIRNATPFLIPKLGAFTGVGDHTEGTAHRPEGTLELDERTLAPKAVSGAFRLSRELIDSSNPALDRLAVAAMLKDYRKDTERRLATLLLSGVSTVGGIDTVQALRSELVGFGSDDIEADAVLAGRGFFQAMVLDLDGNLRPLLPFVGPTNASGTTKAGYTGASVDGVEIVKSSSLPTDRAVIVDWDTVLVAESATQTFRFDEVEGPGIVKLALFGYYGAALLELDGVAELSTEAVPVE